MQFSSDALCAFRRFDDELSRQGRSRTYRGRAINIAFTSPPSTRPHSCTVNFDDRSIGPRPEEPPTDESSSELLVVIDSLEGARGKIRETNEHPLGSSHSSP